MIKYYWFIIAVIFAFLSSIRFSILPEFQVMLILIVLCFVKHKQTIICTLICVLCTHTYAIPDIIYRGMPETYPSIYTKSIILSIKSIDIISIAVVIYSFPKIVFIKNIKGISLLAILFIVSVFATIMNFIFGVSDWSYALFYMRSFILVLGMFGIVCTLDKSLIIDSLFYSMWCWIMKMIFMILFPSDNVILREIFGFNWKIFFAGDEYLSFGMMSACILLLAYTSNFSSEGFIKVRNKCFLFCFIALILALISQRKGSIPYFTLVFIMIYLSASYKKYRVLSALYNMVLIFSASSFFILFYFLYDFLPDVLKLALNEYYILYVSAIDSVRFMLDNNPLGAVLGVGVAGLYRVMSLPEYADHVFSFGSEVGKEFRYAIWNLPLGRLSINSGIIGVIISLVFLLKRIIISPFSFYLFFGIIPFFAMYGVTPISAIYVGFSLGALYKCSVSINTAK